MVNEQEVFGGESSKRMEDLQQRVVEHNILVPPPSVPRLRIGSAIPGSRQFRSARVCNHYTGALRTILGVVLGSQEHDEDGCTLLRDLTALQVIKKYYSRITLPRLSQLLDVDVAKAEKHLSEMVVSKVDRKFCLLLQSRSFSIHITVLLLDRNLVQISFGSHE